MQRLNITNILQWRCELGIAKCNKYQKIVEKIQCDPENFISKAVEILQELNEKKLESKKPLPNPRPVNFLPLSPTETKSNVEVKESEKEEADEELLVDFLFKEIIKDDSDGEDDEVILSLQPKVGENTIEQKHELYEKQPNEDLKEIDLCRSSKSYENLPGEYKNVYMKSVGYKEKFILKMRCKKKYSF